MKSSETEHAVKLKVETLFEGAVGGLHPDWIRVSERKRMAFDGMSITVDVHEGPTLYRVTVENLKQSIKSQGLPGEEGKGEE